jgi:hypothetical protein
MKVLRVCKRWCDDQSQAQVASISQAVLNQPPGGITPPPLILSYNTYWAAVLATGVAA